VPHPCAFCAQGWDSTDTSRLGLSLTRRNPLPRSRDTSSERVARLLCSSRVASGFDFPFVEGSGFAVALAFCSCDPLLESRGGKLGSTNHLSDRFTSDHDSHHIGRKALGFLHCVVTVMGTCRARGEERGGPSTPQKLHFVKVSAPLRMTGLERVCLRADSREPIPEATGGLRYSRRCGRRCYESRGMRICLERRLLLPDPDRPLRGWLCLEA
jgi:hypothetical protein